MNEDVQDAEVTLYLSVAVQGMSAQVLAPVSPSPPGNYRFGKLEQYHFVNSLTTREFVFSCPPHRLGMSRSLKVFILLIGTTTFLGLLFVHSFHIKNLPSAAKWVARPVGPRNLRAEANISLLLSSEDQYNDLAYWKGLPMHQKVIEDPNFKPLSADLVERVEKLLFFTGYPRSGHSIVGSLLDAHPNIILSYAFFLFRGLVIPSRRRKNIEVLLQNKTLLFNTMYEFSYRYSQRSGQKPGKGYTLDVPGLWSGRHNGTLQVIGDKSATAATTAYTYASHAKFKNRYNHLAKCVGIELVGIHVVRNPYDMIATQALYEVKKYSWKKYDMKAQMINQSVLKEVVEFYFEKARAVKEMVPLCGMNVIDVHSEDLIKSPRKQLLRLCHFLGVDCSEEYLQICEGKIFSEVSRTRDNILWPPDVKADIQKRIQDFEFFRGYTFQDDFYNST